MLNIIMNAKDIDLGETLEKFKMESKDLNPPMRGHLLSKHAAIRKAHNSFTRRLDLLNADLAMENEVRNSTTKRIKVTGRKKKKKKTPATEAAFHFIAYVPVDGKVWQLDGLEGHPICIGKSPSLCVHAYGAPVRRYIDPQLTPTNTVPGEFDEDWMDVARPAIGERMQVYGLSFNLLALCRKPSVSIRQNLAVSVKSLASLKSKINGQAEWSAELVVDPEWIDGDDEDELAKFGMTSADLESDHCVSRAREFAEELEKPSFDLAAATGLYQKLCEEQDRLRREYRAELVSEEDDVLKATARKNDYTPAIHEWVARLAEHGVLQELKEESERKNLHHQASCGERSQ
jgi:ubiquitin carboxyl-terminal hydrolase L5